MYLSKSLDINQCWWITWRRGFQMSHLASTVVDESLGLNVWRWRRVASRRTKTTLPVDDEKNCLSDDKLQFEVHCLSSVTSSSLKLLLRMAARMSVIRMSRSSTSWHECRTLSETCDERRLKRSSLILDERWSYSSSATWKFVLQWHNFLLRLWWNLMIRETRLSWLNNTF